MPLLKSNRRDIMATTTVTTNPLLELSTQGQSVWYDNISRGLITSGDLQRLLDDGIVGFTSNPTIFEKAIVGSSDYDDALRQIAKETTEPWQVYQTLAGEDIRRIASVASIFVSRIDTAVDKLLDEKLAKTQDPAEQQALRSLQGKAAIANAKATYRIYQEIFHGERFEALRRKGARPQRPLWASTSTKNPAYRDVLYVESLIGPDTVDTMPPQTIVAFKDHGQVSATLVQDLDHAQQVLDELEAKGINMDAVMQKLQDDGVAAFAKSYETLLGAIKQKLEALRAEVA